MKKLLIILGIVLFAVIAALIVIPIMFKPQILRLVKEKAGQNINAELNFHDLSLSLLRNFPNATLTIERLTIVNREPFQGDTLAAIGRFQATLNLPKLILQREAEVRSLTIERPIIILRTLKDGHANWDIMPKKVSEAETGPADTASALALAVEKYNISDGFILYADEATDTYAMIDGLSHEGKGDFRKAVFTLATKTKIDSFDFRAGGIPYLDKAALEIKADLEMDMNKKRIAFKENEIRLNQLFLKFDGWVMTADSLTDVDLTFTTPRTDFKSILSMVPYIYSRDFKDLKAEGRLSLDGRIKGTYGKARVPMVDLKIFVDNGMFQYPDLPSAVRNFTLDLQISNPGTTIDASVIDLRRLHFEILNEPVDAQLLVKTPVSDPYLDGSLKGNIDLAQVKDVMPMGKGVELAGKVHSDFSFRGNLSSIKRKETRGFTALGALSFSDIRYSSPQLPAPVRVSKADITLSPEQARLQSFEMTIGKSDLRAQGSLDNIFGYVLAKQVLTGSLALQSNYFDLNPFMQQEGGALQAVELPDRVEFSMTGEFKKLTVTNMTMTEMKSRLLLKDRKLSLIDLTANFLGGTMLTNGTYSYFKPGNPHVDLDLKLSDMSIPDMFKTLVTVRSFAPVAGYMQGRLSGNFKINSDLGDSLIPILETVSSKGKLQIPEARIKDFVPINKIADALQFEPLRDPGISNFDPSYTINNGVFNIDPTTLKIAKYQVIMSGSNSLDKSIAYNLKLQIPAADLKANMNSAISNLVGRDLNLLTNENIIINVDVGGTIDKPQVKTALSQIAKGAAEEIKQEALREAERRKQELEAEARQKMEQQKSSLEDSLKKQLESQKKEGEEKLKEKIKGLFGR